MKPLYGYDLLQRGCEVLAEIERNGMRVDVDYCQKTQRRLQRKTQRCFQQASETEAGKIWHKKYRGLENFQSGPQLADVLFNEMGYAPKAWTPTGLPKTSVDALELIDDPIIPFLKQGMKYQKAASTYLENFILETTNGLMRPFFNLHTTRTYRSSSDHPNFQNIPVRDAEIAKIIRKAIIPRPGNQIVEVDFSGLEVRVAACYHRDPVMLRYIKNPKKDMHRDMAAECFCVPVSEVSKEMRFYGKNGFVFPAFYGSYFRQIAPNLWGFASDLKTVSSQPVRDVLKAQGIKRLGECNPKKPPAPGTYERHIQKVETDFWNKRFRVYGRWKKRWFSEYQRHGFFDSLTGFRYSGLMVRNDVINYPIQGSAFHCLLLSLIRLQERIVVQGKSVLIIGQIHDSIVVDLPPSELDWFIGTAKEIMENQILEEWDWIIVPLEIDFDVAPPDASWFEKKSI